MVICLERGADLHMAPLMPLPLTVSCFSRIQIGFTFLVPAHLGSPGQSAVKRVYFVGTALILWRARCMHLSGVRPSVSCYRFAAVGPAGGRYRSLAARCTAAQHATGKCGQCHVVSICRKLNTDSFHRFFYYISTVYVFIFVFGWLSSRVVSVLDLGPEGPVLKSQSRRCRVTVLGKLFTPIVPLFVKQQNW